jgi:selenocysteine-specific elongation factor
MEDLVQIVLDRPIGALYGDGLIVRDQSAQRTIGGGRVLDIFPPVRGRAKPERLAYLRAMNNDDTSAAFTSLLFAASRGLNLGRFAQNRNLTAEEAAQLFASRSTKSVATSSGVLGFSPENWNRLKTAVVEALTSLHRRAPAVIPNEERVFREAGLRLPREVTSALAAEMIKGGVVVREAAGVRLRTHAPQLSQADAALWTKTEPLLNGDMLRPSSCMRFPPRSGWIPKRRSRFSFACRAWDCWYE